MDSILTSIKKLLGIPEEYEQFDMDIILHINSVFMILNQLGVGPAEMYRIADKNDKWLDFVTDYDDLDAVKSYMFLKRYVDVEASTQLVLCIESVYGCDIKKF